MFTLTPPPLRRPCPHRAQAGQLLSAVCGLRNKFGLGRSVAVLRGSKAKDVQPWMMDVEHAVTGGEVASCRLTLGYWCPLAPPSGPRVQEPGECCGPDALRCPRA